MRTVKPTWSEVKEDLCPQLLEAFSSEMEVLQKLIELGSGKLALGDFVNDFKFIRVPSFYEHKDVFTLVITDNAQHSKYYYLVSKVSSMCRLKDVLGQTKIIHSGLKWDRLW